MKRKNLSIDLDNIKRIKTYDAKNERQKILECYNALAKLCNDDPAICFNPEPQLDVKRYIANICSRVSHFLKFTSDKIVTSSVGEIFANNAPRLIENITKE